MNFNRNKNEVIFIPIQNIDNTAIKYKKAEESGNSCYYYLSSAILLGSGSIKALDYNNASSKVSEINGITLDHAQGIKLNLAQLDFKKTSIFYELDANSGPPTISNEFKDIILQANLILQAFYFGGKDIIKERDEINVSNLEIRLGNNNSYDDEVITLKTSGITPFILVHELIHFLKHTMQYNNYSDHVDVSNSTNILNENFSGCAINLATLLECHYEHTELEDYKLEKGINFLPLEPCEDFKSRITSATLRSTVFTFCRECLLNKINRMCFKIPELQRDIITFIDSSANIDLVREDAQQIAEIQYSFMKSLNAPKDKLYISKEDYITQMKASVIKNMKENFQFVLGYGFPDDTDDVIRARKRAVKLIEKIVS